ncbi:hypothetical protein [Micromonospora sp. NPDC005305]
MILVAGNDDTERSWHADLSMGSSRARARVERLLACSPLALRRS